MVTKNILHARSVLWGSFIANSILIVIASFLQSSKLIVAGVFVINLSTLLGLYWLGRRGSADEKGSIAIYLQSAGVLAAAVGVAGAFKGVGFHDLNKINAGSLMNGMTPFIEGMFATGLSSMLSSFLVTESDTGTPTGSSGGSSPSGATGYAGAPGGGIAGLDPTAIDTLNEQMAELSMIMTEVNSSAKEMHSSMKNMNSTVDGTEKLISQFGKLMESFGKFFFSSSTGGTP